MKKTAAIILPKTGLFLYNNISRMNVTSHAVDSYNCAGYRGRSGYICEAPLLKGKVTAKGVSTGHGVPKQQPIKKQPSLTKNPPIAIEGAYRSAVSQTSIFKNLAAGNAQSTAVASPTPQRIAGRRGRNVMGNNAAEARADDERDKDSCG